MMARPPRRSWTTASARGGGRWLLLVVLSCGSCSGDDGAAASTSDGSSGPITSCDNPSQRARTYYVDADGDGYGVPGAGAKHGCFETAPAGYSVNARDCDDGDAAKHIERYRDRDGDGHGDSSAMACVAEDAADYADRGGDCDDDSAEVAPGMAEVWLDGVDQDCDGSDELRGCIAAPGTPAERYATPKVIPFPELDDVTVPRVDTCQGADLYFVLAGGCPVCAGGESTVVVGNRGTVAAVFAVESNVQRLAVDEPLPPQALSRPLTLEVKSPGSELRIVPLDGAVDCDAGNDTRRVEFGYTDCAAP